MCAIEFLVGHGITKHCMRFLREEHVTKLHLVMGDEIVLLHHLEDWRKLEDKEVIY